jgi:hypothetical protein
MILPFYGGEFRSRESRFERFRYLTRPPIPMAAPAPVPPVAAIPKPADDNQWGWPILDFTIPEDDRRRLLCRVYERRHLVPSRMPRPQRTIADSVAFVGPGMVIGASVAFVLFATFVTTIILKIVAAIRAADILDRSAPIMFAVNLMLAAAGALFWGLRTEHPDRRLARVYHGGYILHGDLDAEGERMVARARAAIGIIVNSNVNRQGLLDDIANHVILPQQIWQVALLAHKQSALRDEQHRTPHAVPTAALESALAPQRRALARSEAVLTKRVESLETYARRVQEADSALLAQSLLANDPKYQELLAATDDEESVRELRQQADQVEAELRTVVLAATEAGRILGEPEFSAVPTDDGD